MNIYNSVSELIGKTPLVRLNNIEKELNLNAKILVKLEHFNPFGSVKDRVAKFIVEDAIEKGTITKDSVVIEPTSGNTGIGIAGLCASMGIRVIIVMPSTMSEERKLLMRAYGAELVLTDGKLGMKGAIAEAERLKNTIPSSIIAGQFVNPMNPYAHMKTTGPELVEDTDGKIDIFVAGVGTGGTVSGVGEYLKKNIKNVEIIAVEPKDSPVLSGGKAGPHGIQGIGAGFIPEILNRDVIDKVEVETLENAKSVARMLGKKEGILCGISSGASLSVAINEAKKECNRGKTIVVLLPDGGDRYLSSGLFE